MTIFRLPKADEKANETVKVHNDSNTLLEVVANSETTLNGFSSSGVFPSAFNHNITNKWQSTTEISYITNTSDDPIKIKSIGIYCDGTDGSPTSFTIEGSNDNSNFDILDTITNEHWNIAEWKQYRLNNSLSYKYYKLNITDTKADQPAHISSIELYKNTINEDGRLKLFKNECYELLSNGTNWIILHNNPSAWKKIFSETKTDSDIQTNYFNIPIGGYDNKYKIIVYGTATVTNYNLKYTINNDNSANYRCIRIAGENSNTPTTYSVLTSGITWIVLDPTHQGFNELIIENIIGYKFCHSELTSKQGSTYRMDSVRTWWQNNTDVIRNIQIKGITTDNATVTVEVYKMN